MWMIAKVVISVGIIVLIPTFFDWLFQPRDELEGLPVIVASLLFECLLVPYLFMWSIS